MLVVHQRLVHPSYYMRRGYYGCANPSLPNPGIGRFSSPSSHVPSPNANAMHKKEKQKMAATATPVSVQLHLVAHGSNPRAHGSHLPG